MIGLTLCLFGIKIKIEMNLSVLLQIIEKSPSFSSLIKRFKESRKVGVTAIPNAWPMLIAAINHAFPYPILVITSRPDTARHLYDQINPWCPEFGCLLFPEPDTLPGERLAADPATVQGRLKVLFSLVNHLGKRSYKSNLIVISSSYALAQKTIPRKVFDSSCHVIRAGAKVNLPEILKKWTSLGYEFERVVELPGTFSRRGGIIDIYPHVSPYPVRMELEGNLVESLRFFDPASQRSLEITEEVFIGPAVEMVITAEHTLPDGLKSLDPGKKSADMAFYASLFNTGTLFDYLPENSLVISEPALMLEKSVNEIHAEAEKVRREQVETGELPGDFPLPCLSWPDFDRLLHSVSPSIELCRPEEETWSPENRIFFDFQAAPSYGGQLHSCIGDIARFKKNGRHIIIASHQARRLSELLEEQDIIAGVTTDLKVIPAAGDVALVQGMLDGGWTFQSGKGENYVLFTDKEIFGFVKQRREVKRRPAKRQLFLSEVEPGNYVVHADHGIALFKGTTVIQSEGIDREYVILEYAEGDKLYVPADQAGHVTRYVGASDHAPRLNRLGTQEWGRTRQRTREAVLVVARELLSIYASRELKEGYAFSPDTVWQQEMESSFPYVETPDQMKAVIQVKEDMETPRPMDRLVCGDVGYGKTEVALRAAFKCIMDGKQAVILVPTTILAQQHFNTFSERLKPYPVNVEVLSRFRSEKEQNSIVEGLKLGTVDLCIGTHRLLQKDIVLKNLGLVVIDEEQRFGVKHKEHFKILRQEVDVLTLSATPIPRTLYMSLVGVRNMSAMETPPEERLPIKTMVGPYHDRVVREAITREIERGGQVFFVHNRVHNINAVAEKLRLLLPEIRIDVAHGQMPEDTLEKVMLDFSRGNSDVLVCTTIIESGLDMPNVNTLIINEADKLGLTQLYQLRGRVGRGVVRAYAYFLYNKGRELTETAEKRLQAIVEAAELGAGYRLAMKDLEIRGAGNLLGTEQSGHISAVGFELYCQYLSQAVNELKKAGNDKEKPLIGARQDAASPVIDLPLSAFIPETYLPDLGMRLSVYQRLTKITSEDDVEETARELTDRFGEYPPQVKNLLYLLKVKVLARKAGLSGIGYEQSTIILRLPEGRTLTGKKMEDRYYGFKAGWNQVRFSKKEAGPKWQELLENYLRDLSLAS